MIAPRALISGFLVALLSACSSAPSSSKPPAQAMAMSTPDERTWLGWVTDPLSDAWEGMGKLSQAVAKPIIGGVRRVGGTAGGIWGKTKQWLPQAASLETLKRVPQLLPGVQSADQVDANDPTVPFAADSALARGHTLRLEVYEGTRSPDRVIEQVVMVDASGEINLGQAGRLRVLGLHLPQAVEAIASQCRLNLSLGRSNTVQILSVENLPLVAVTGEIRRPRHLALNPGLTLDQAVALCGGRPPKTGHRAVYLTRRGERRFFTDLGAATGLSLQAGDVIELSSDL